MRQQVRQDVLQHGRHGGNPPFGHRPGNELVLEVQRVVASALIGGIVGVILIIGFVFVAAFLPMLARRKAMLPTETHQESTTPDGTPIPITGGTSRLPQIDWNLILTDEEKENEAALAQDISSMSETSQDDFLTWITLPYPASGWYGDDRFDLMSQLVDCVYDRNPELSVYTNGQCVESCVAFSRCHLIDASGDDKETNRSEVEAVTRAADRLHAEIEAEIAKSSGSGWMTACTADEAYVILLYERLSAMTTYSDDKGDTKHANDIYGALLEGESKCYGVASAAKALLNRRGIPSFMASGSVGGDEDQRHAWVLMWIGNQWKALDITTGQGRTPPETVNVTEALSGSQGYWGGCMCPFDEFVKKWDMKVDEQCLRLMSAYEESIGIRFDADIPMPAPMSDVTHAARHEVGRSRWTWRG